MHVEYYDCVHRSVHAELHANAISMSTLHVPGIADMAKHTGTHGGIHRTHRDLVESKLNSSHAWVSLGVFRCLSLDAFQPFLTDILYAMS